MMVRELGFEMKAQPSEKLKTPEELAREEREKLQKLEVINIEFFHPCNQHKYLKGILLTCEAPESPKHEVEPFSMVRVSSRLTV